MCDQEKTATEDRAAESSAGATELPPLPADKDVDLGCGGCHHWLAPEMERPDDE